MLSHRNDPEWKRRTIQIVGYVDRAIKDYLIQAGIITRQRRPPNYVDPLVHKMRNDQPHIQRYMQRKAQLSRDLQNMRRTQHRHTNRMPRSSGE